MIRHLVIALCLLSACATQTPTPAKVAPAEPAATPKAPEPSACVQTCTDSRRTEAMGWDAIVAQCEAQCAKAP